MIKPDIEKARERPNDGRYYAEGDVVWKAPVTTPDTAGGTLISMGFPVCTMHHWAGDDAAETVARLLNAGTAALNSEDRT